MRCLTLLYHDLVGEDPDASGFRGGGPARYKLSPEEFERHLDAIASVRPDGPSLDGPGAAVSPLPFRLTFDDGGSSAMRAADALEKRGWFGHFFVTAQPIGTPGFVTSAEIRDLGRRGHAVGSHSFSHPDPMSGLPPERILDEWRQSVGVLEQILGAPVTTASVPGGAYARPVAAAAASAGLRMLFTSEPTTRVAEVDGCQVLGRFTLRRGSASRLAAALAGGRRGPQLLQALAWNSRKALKRAAGPYYLRLRRLLLSRGAGGS